MNSFQVKPGMERNFKNDYVVFPIDFYFHFHWLPRINFLMDVIGAGTF